MWKWNMFIRKKTMTNRVKAKTVAFEVVELWCNDIYTPYTMVPESEESVRNYAIKIGMTSSF